MSRKNKKSDHRLLGSGAGWIEDREFTYYPLSWDLKDHTVMETNRWMLTNGFTNSGYQVSGGRGRARCSCGVYSPVLETREQRRKWFKDHKGDQYPEIPEWETRNALLKDLAQAVDDEWHLTPEEITETPLFVTAAERALFNAITRKGVVKDLVQHYRKARR